MRRASHFFTAKTQSAQRHRTIAVLTQRRRDAEAQRHRNGDSRLTGRAAPACSRGIEARKADLQTPAFVESTFRTSGRTYGAPARPQWIGRHRHPRADRKNEASIEVSERQAGSSPLQWIERLCSAGVPPAPHALMQASWIRVLSTSQDPRPVVGQASCLPSRIETDNSAVRIECDAAMNQNCDALCNVFAPLRLCVSNLRRCDASVFAMSLRLCASAFYICDGAMLCALCVLAVQPCDAR